MATNPYHSSLEKLSGCDAAKPRFSWLSTDAPSCAEAFHHSSFHSNTTPPTQIPDKFNADRFGTICFHSPRSKPACMGWSSEPSMSSREAVRYASAPYSARNIGLAVIDDQSLNKLPKLAPR